MSPDLPLPRAWDHTLVVALIALLPLHGAWVYRRLVHRARTGDPDARAREYRVTMILQWTLTGGIVAAWLGLARPAAALGFALPGGARGAVGAAVTLAALALLWAQWRAVQALDEKGREGLRGQMASVADLLPRTPREARLFRGLALTAGVCEEIVFRGYLIWYLAVAFGAWPAAFLAGIAFGAGHVYQGAQGVVKTGVVGIVTGVLYVGTGSLLWPVILHVAIDLNSGAIAYRVLRGEQGAMTAA